MSDLEEYKPTVWANDISIEVVYFSFFDFIA